MRGIDVSHFQVPEGTDPSVEANKVLSDAFHAQHGFVIAKATQGTNFVDSTVTAWAAAAQKFHRRFGVYHYADGDNDPLAEADWFWWWVVALNLDAKIDFAVLDVEWRSKSGAPIQPGWVDTWCNRTLQRTGERPFVYSFLRYWDAATWQDVSRRWRLWVARTGSVPQQPDVPWTIWQYGQEELAGRMVDVNVWPKPL